MANIINYENFRSFAYCNDKQIVGEIKGVIVRYVGLDGNDMFDDNMEQGIFFADRNILLIIPYHNPWAWMNRATIKFADELMDVIFDKYKLDEKTPVVFFGGSMGGQGALVYSVYAKHRPVACVTNCPVCDLVSHFNEREDLPRTLYTSFIEYDMDFEDALKTASPVHLIDRMPRINYYIFHCVQDEAVNINLHSDKFVKLLEDNGHSVTYHRVHEGRHCCLNEELNKLFNEYIVRSCGENSKMLFA